MAALAPPLEPAISERLSLAIGRAGYRVVELYRVYTEKGGDCEVLFRGVEHKAESTVPHVWTALVPYEDDAPTLVVPGW
jgi:hypothetical protein